MKKIIITILLITAMLISCVSCQVPDTKTEEKSTSENTIIQAQKPAVEYKSLVLGEIGNNDGFNSVKSAFAVDYWNPDNTIKENMPDRTFEFEGKVYDTKYAYTRPRAKTSFTIDYYYTDSVHSFGVRSDNNQLVHVNLADEEFFNTEFYLPDIENPKGAAVNKAIEVASEIVTNIEDYTMSINRVWTNEREKEGKVYTVENYNIYFAKIINGIETSDFISICITSKGHLVSMLLGDIGAFDDVSFVINNDALVKAETSAIKSVVESDIWQYISCEKDEEFLVKTPDGKMCILTLYTYEQQHKTGEKQVCFGKTYVLTEINTQTNTTPPIVAEA